METSFQLQVANGSGRQARQLVERALKSWRLWHQGEGPLVTNTMIVVTELVENVERHTAAGGKLNLHLRPGALLIEVTDTSTQVPVLCEKDHRRADGRGLLLIDAIATRWGTRSIPGGKVVWAEVSVR